MKTPTKTARRKHAFGDLYELLEKKFPTLRTSRDAFDVQAFAVLLDYSKETVYKTLRESENLKLSVALRIIEASHENQGTVPLYWDDLLPFIIPTFAKYSAPGDVDDLLG